MLEKVSMINATCDKCKNVTVTANSIEHLKEFGWKRDKKLDGWICNHCAETDKYEADPFALYDMPGKKKATAEMKKCIKDFMKEFQKIMDKYIDIGATDTASREAISQYIWNLM